MALPIKQTAESRRSSAELTTPGDPFSEGGLATKRRFEHAYCGVLVSLIFAIIAILLVVGLIAIAGLR